MSTGLPFIECDCNDLATPRFLQRPSAKHRRGATLEMFAQMTIGVLLAQLAEVDWLSPILRIATRLYLEVRPFALRIDEPKNGCIDRNINVIHGWFICPARNQTISLRLGHVELTWREAEREDVRRIFGSGVRGFRAVVDREVIDGADKSTSLELVVDGATVASKSLRLIYDGATHTETSTRKRAAKREWLKNNVACPACHSKERTLTFTDNEVCCVSCGSSFKDDGKIFNFLPDNFKIQFNISDWGDISVHNYDEEAKEVIADVRRKGGKLLDCGSGLRSEVDEAVVCLEVEAFPNVDILGVNQRLPFPDAVFDAVLSLNVLEHVTDPFACAAELVRVLKPGGTLYCCIPFLQPEHGYPDHYFNATRSGLRQLFTRELELVRHFVPPSGEPIWTLHWFLSWYLLELPGADRQELLNMRVQDLLANSPAMLLPKPWVAHLSENGKWRLASTTAALFRKCSAED